MTARSWTEIQTELIRLGYDLGPSGADGDPGRMTKAAVAKYQRDQSINVKYPGTVGPKTIAKLFPDEPVKPAPLVIAPWVSIGLTKQGLAENGNTKGALVKFLKSDGKTLGDPAKYPWCGDFVQTCIALALPSEPVPTNPYWARNWLKFGQDIEPTFGAVVVFSRGNSGHVAFVLGETEDRKNWVILGGNQSNRISTTTKAKLTTLGTRWPSTVDMPTIHLPKMVGGKLSVNEA